MNNYDLNDLIEAEIDRLDNYEWLFEAEDATHLGASLLVEGLENDETI